MPSIGQAASGNCDTHRSESPAMKAPKQSGARSLPAAAAVAAECEILSCGAGAAVQAGRPCPGKAEPPMLPGIPDNKHGHGLACNAVGTRTNAQRSTRSTGRNGLGPLETSTLHGTSQVHRMHGFMQLWRPEFLAPHVLSSSLTPGRRQWRRTAIEVMDALSSARVKSSMARPCSRTCAWHAHLSHKQPVKAY